jgi:hypothetical protein
MEEMQPRARSTYHGPILSVVGAVRIVQATLDILRGNGTLKNEKLVHLSQIAICVAADLI